ncbi:hypothetical protein BOTNAR_0852g00030 [Botryotinia narcissicola]|uniref:Uncharacterized protein n=1 Tax=Botryotinia narcissicola TaxID=278944 RepID=A0A4Z1HH47_9HELO|nr:hypothetical protein BOTNAR_0852g00030 [Botryotinia narcissicola]
MQLGMTNTTASRLKPKRTGKILEFLGVRKKTRLSSEQLEKNLVTGEADVEEEGSSNGSTVTAKTQIQECATAELSIVEGAPTEIINRILNTLLEQELPDIFSALCFGLTSRRNWEYFVTWTIQATSKNIWTRFPPRFLKGPIMVRSILNPSQRQQLILLKEWLGPKYRPPNSLLIPSYLSCAVYGESNEENIEEEILEDRFYHLIMYQATKVNIPSPFGLGDVWKAVDMTRMPPRSPPTPKSKQFLEPNQLRSDTYILQTLPPTIASTPTPNIPTTITTTYNTGRPLRPASERGNGATTASQVSFEVRDRLTANPNQFKGTEVHRQHLMRPREIAVEMTVDKVRKAPSAGPSPVKSKKRPAEDTKAEKDGTSSQHARKRRYNTAKRRAAKFDFPTEITRLILRCLISEHQTFESDFCTAVCFGLTCRTHWAIFRSIYSGKIPLLVQSPNTFNQRKAFVPYRLGDLLVKWMFPTYRPLPCQLLKGKMVIADTASISVYVSFAAYPNVGGEKDQRLLERMAQYRQEYARHYQVWSIYKTWMIRDWVEAQPEAMAYKRSRGLGEDKTKVGMRDGFEMLKLVDVQTKEHKLRVKQVVDMMLRFIEGRQSYDF